MKKWKEGLTHSLDIHWLAEVHLLGFTITSLCRFTTENDTANRQVTIALWLCNIL